MRNFNLCVVVCVAFVLMPLAVCADAPDPTIDTRLASSVAKLKGSLRAEEQGKTNIVTKTLSSAGAEATENTAHMSFSMLKGLGLCIGVFLIGTALVKRTRLGSGNVPQQRLQVLERTAITSKHALVLAQLDGHDIILAVGPDSLAFHQPVAIPGPQIRKSEEIWNEKVVHVSASAS